MRPISPLQALNAMAIIAASISPSEGKMPGDVGYHGKRSSGRVVGIDHTLKSKRVPRNSPCPCGCGQKAKKCPKKA